MSRPEAAAVHRALFTLCGTRRGNRRHSTAMARCLIALGANLGRPEQTLNEAIQRLALGSGIDAVARSRWRMTAPAGGPAGQPPFLNGAAVLHTSLEPRALWQRLAQVEAQFGRRRDHRWGPRTVDLDLLLYDRLVLASPQLLLPHPRMAWRRFVLEPAAEIAGDWLHPTIGWTVQRLWQHLQRSANYLALAGGTAAARRALGRAVAQRAGAVLLSDAQLPPPAGPPGPDSAGTARPAAVKFLRSRAERLRPGAAGLVVSDFWFEECLLEAGRSLPPGDGEAYRRDAARLRAAVVQPRLLVILPDDAPSAAARPSWAATLQQHAAAIQQGPVLPLAADPSAPALDEILGAVAAMQ